MIVAKINASWNDDEREISCQTENNQDPYLIRRINLTVECELQNREFAVVCVTCIRETRDHAPNLLSMLIYKFQLLVLTPLGNGDYQIVITDLNNF